MYWKVRTKARRRAGLFKNSDYEVSGRSRANACIVCNTKGECFQGRSDLGVLRDREVPHNKYFAVEKDRCECLGKRARHPE